MISIQTNGLPGWNQNLVCPEQVQLKLPYKFRKARGLRNNQLLLFQPGHFRILYNKYHFLYKPGVFTFFKICNDRGRSSFCSAFRKYPGFWHPCTINIAYCIYIGIDGIELSSCCGCKRQEAVKGFCQNTNNLNHGTHRSTIFQ